MRSLCLPVLLSLGCVTSTTAVTRNLLAPLPAMPMTMFDDSHRAQLELGGQLHPLPLQVISTTSGLGAPFGQGDLGAMVRVGKRVVVGAQLELASPEGARFAHPTSRADTSALGLRVGTHVMILDGERFGLDASGQVSLHTLPIFVAQAVPLSVGSQLSTEYTAMPGIEVAVLPRVKTGGGTFFGGVSIASSPDIALNGTRTVFSDGTVSNGAGAGVSPDPVVMVGAGWAWSLPSGVGLKAQVWMPVTRGPIGYGPIFGLGLQYAFGEPLRPTPPRRPAPLTAPPLLTAPEEDAVTGL
jgi:hypothetical protein